MTKLLSANFRRLWKSKTFWIGLIVMFAASLFNVLGNNHYNSMLADQASRVTADQTLLPNAFLTVIVVGVFISLFIGREHGDKTIRNKIVTGHSRASIYCANVIVCSVAALILYVLPVLIVGFALGAPLLGGFKLPFSALVLPVVCSLLATIAFVSLFVIILMLISNRTVNAIVVLLSAFILMSIPVLLCDALEAPEYIEDLGYVDEAGEYIPSDEIVKNPSYLTGIPRLICEFICDFIPSGQLNQISIDAEAKDMVFLPIYSVLFTVISSGIGIYFFRRKELK